MPLTQRLTLAGVSPYTDTAPSCCVPLQRWASRRSCSWKARPARTPCAPPTPSTRCCRQVIAPQRSTWRLQWTSYTATSLCDLLLLLTACSFSAISAAQQSFILQNRRVRHVSSRTICMCQLSGCSLMYACRNDIPQRWSTPTLSPTTHRPLPRITLRLTLALTLTPNRTPTPKCPRPLRRRRSAARRPTRRPRMRGSDWRRTSASRRPSRRGRRGSCPTGIGRSGRCATRRATRLRAESARQLHTGLVV